MDLLGCSRSFFAYSKRYSTVLWATMWQTIWVNVGRALSNNRRRFFPWQARIDGTHWCMPPLASFIHYNCKARTDDCSTTDNFRVICRRMRLCPAFTATMTKSVWQVVVVHERMAFLLIQEHSKLCELSAASGQKSSHVPKIIVLIVILARNHYSKFK